MVAVAVENVTAVVRVTARRGGRRRRRRLKGKTRKAKKVVKNAETTTITSKINDSKNRPELNR